MTFDDLTTEQHRQFRPYTRSGVFRSKLSPAQIALLETAGEGGTITAKQAGNWRSLLSMADKGAVTIVEREVRQTPKGPINGRVLMVRVK